MIKKIKRIKNLGIFGDYTWNNNTLNDFKQYNIIYGWNGSGKTTLTRLFDTLESGSSQEFTNLEYEIDSDSGIFRQDSQYTRKIRVFNQDYVINNVQILNCKASPIFILGEENKKVIDKIESDESELKIGKEKIIKIEGNINGQIEKRNKIFTDIARVISSNTSGEATRRYDKRNAEDAFKLLNDKNILNEEEINKYNLTRKQLEKPLISIINQSKYEFEGKFLDLNDLFPEIYKIAKIICETTVETLIINRLKDNSDVSNWVEDGIVIHNKHKSKLCEFCNQSLPKDRLRELAKYFNEADKKLKDNVENLLSELRKIYPLIDIKPMDKANLYDELQDTYKKLVDQLEKEKCTILNEITNFAEVIKSKKNKTTEALPIECNIKIDILLDIINDINNEIIKHNDKTNNFKKEKEISQRELEKHYLSTIYDEVKKIDIDVLSYKIEYKKVIKSNNELLNIINDEKGKISSPVKACKEINDGIKTFLGRNEITFEVEDNGYIIRRGGKVADNLSEGEKTAIAFVYFTVHIHDQDFDVKEGVLVIDDPISSLDSNSQFQAFAFLKNSVKDAKQVFIFTHNFDFLRLLLNWLKYEKNEPKSSFYMITNPYINEKRSALINKLDKNLELHESEYHYLFKKLYRYVSDGTIETAYNMPNISRKLLETFLMFRVPSSEKTYKKLQGLTGKFDENKLTAIYKFTNDQSHITGKGFDPSLVAETQKNVKYILEMIEATFPEHFEILKASIDSQSINS